MLLLLLSTLALSPPGERGVGGGVRRYQMLSRSSGHMYCSSGAQLSLVNANGEGEVVHSQEEEDFAATTASPLGDI